MHAGEPRDERVAELLHHARLVDADAVRSALASFGLPITLHVNKVRKGGFAATQVWVQAPEEKSHRHLPDVEEILNKGEMTAAARPRDRE